ncbi:MAG: CBS domain-containing protein [Thiohalocapsa sp.]
MQTVSQLLDHKGHQVWTIDPDASVLDAIQQMSERDAGALVVMEGPRMLGIMSERQYARSVALTQRPSDDTRVRDVMRTGVPVIDPGTKLITCMQLITEHRTRHLPVMIGEELVGLVSIGDLVAAIIADQQSTIEQLESYIATG